LLLVRSDAEAPIVTDVLEDWVREPCQPADVAARLAGLRRRAAQQRASPTLDEDGRLHFGGRWVQLSPIDTRLAKALVDRFDRSVSESTLVLSGWADRQVTPAALRSHLDRLRLQTRPLGLELRKLRGRGWILHQSASRAGSPQAD
jgi:DNA-binding response OmpR family regulator